jgi:hypothetical protein
VKIGDAKRILAQGAAQVGGIAQLANELGISERVLRHYIEGSEPVPDTLVLAVMDVLNTRTSRDLK